MQTVKHVPTETAAKDIKKTRKDKKGQEKEQRNAPQAGPARLERHLAALLAYARRWRWLVLQTETLSMRFAAQSSLRMSVSVKGRALFGVLPFSRCHAVVLAATRVAAKPLGTRKEVVDCAQQPIVTSL
jgi:hypothetical protein